MNTTVNFPIEAVLYRTNRGLACRLDLHPETRYGLPGKIFFPDRTCTEPLEEGIVVIDAVIEKETYGFFKGKMKMFEAPSDDDLIEYLFSRDSKNIADYAIRTLNGKYGTVIACRRFGDLVDTFLAKGTKAPVEDVSNIINGWNYKEHLLTKRVVSLYDLVCRQNLRCNFKALKEKIILPKLLPVYDSSEYRKMLPELLESAIDTDVFTACDYQGGCYLMPNTLINLALYFNAEEVNEIIDTANKVNQEFDKKLSSLAKKGRIPADVIRRAEKFEELYSISL